MSVSKSTLPRPLQCKLAAALMCGAGLAAMVAAAPTTASATPFTHALALAGAADSAAPGAIETVHWRGRGWGWGGFAAGAIIGGALAAPYYYGPRYYPAPYPAPYPAEAYEDGPGGDAVAYCHQRFKSYDPGTGTYLGYDGARHPCP